MKSLSKIVVAVLIAALAAGILAGCGSKDVAARVNGEAVKKSELDAQLAQIKKQYPQMFQGTDAENRQADFRKRLLDNMINTVLLRQAAKTEGIDVNDDAVNKQLADLEKGFPNKKSFEDALKKTGITEDKLKEQIRDQLITQKLLEKLTKDVKISDKDITSYYAKNKAQFTQKAAVHAEHILFKENDKATATKVLKQLQGGADFATLAKKYSQDPVSAAKGGDLGWPTQPYVTEFQDAADKLAVNQMSPLVHSPFGWHIIKVLGKRGQRVQPLAEVKEQIRQILVQQQQANAYQAYLDGLKKKAKIEYTK